MKKYTPEELEGFAEMFALVMNELRECIQKYGEEGCLKHQSIESEDTYENNFTSEELYDAYLNIIVPGMQHMCGD